MGLIQLRRFEEAAVAYRTVLRSAPRVRQYPRRTSAHTAPDRRHIHHLVKPRYHEERQTHSARYIYTFATRRSDAFLRTSTPIQHVARSLYLPTIVPCIPFAIYWPERSTYRYSEYAVKMVVF